MWISAAFVLPAIAICLSIWYFVRPLPVLFGWKNFQQDAEYIPKQVQELAYEREQGDEYETLVAMDFRPLGTYNDSIGFLAPRIPGLVFVHNQYPVFALLVVGADGQRFVKMSTAGLNKRILETSSSEFSLEANEFDFRASRITAGHAEDVFAAHVQSLDLWQQEGFVPKPSNSLTEYQQQCQDVIDHPITKRLVRSCCIEVCIWSFLTTVLIPCVCGAVIAATANFIPFNFTWWVQCTSICSLGFSFLWYRNTIRFNQNPERSSLKKSVSLLVDKMVEVEKTEHGPRTRFVLPYRNSGVARGNAAINAIGYSTGVFVSGLMAYAGYIGMTQAIGLGGFVFFFMIPVLGASGFILLNLLESSGLAWRIVFNKSRHELSADAQYIYSREKRFLIDYRRKCRVENVRSIRVESLTKCKTVLKFLGGECDSEWGILFVQDHMDTTLLYVAPAYRVDFLVNLANELAATIGLKPNSVNISETILDLGLETETGIKIEKQPALRVV